MTDTPTISQQASVAPDQGNLKRSIAMKLFTTDEQKARVAYTRQPEVIGQIVGEIFAIKKRSVEPKGGDPYEEIKALGDFECVVYATGEVFASSSAYLPRYFLETVAELIEVADKAGGFKGMDVALEIVLVPTGKSIPISYEVRPLIARRPESAVNRMKAALQAAGRLHAALPPPVALTPLDGEVRQLQGHVGPEAGDADETEADDQPPAASTQDAEPGDKARREKAKQPA